jgi:hypothetical protein
MQYEKNVVSDFISGFYVGGIAGGNRHYRLAGRVVAAELGFRA